MGNLISSGGSDAAIHVDGNDNKSEGSGSAVSSAATGEISLPLETRPRVKDAVIKLDDTIATKSRYTNERLDKFWKLSRKVVGSGMSGPVCLAESRLVADNTPGGTGRKCAIKSFTKKGLSTRRRDELKKEVEIYLALDHPHVAKLEAVFESEEDIHLVMEYMQGGELYARLTRKKQYSEELAASTTRQMLLAVAYLHDKQIAHRDLKLENFLYESETTDNLKLIDFGFAKFWDHSTMMSQACGSAHYVAPEVLRKCYTYKADCWSLGVLVYMLLTGSPPFHGSDDEVLRKIKKGVPQYSSRFHKLSELAQQFVQALIVVDPNERLTAQQALDHPWIQRHNKEHETTLDVDILRSLRDFAHASSFRRAVLSMMAWSLDSRDRQQLEQVFLDLDKDKTGTITHKEMRCALEDIYHVESEEAEQLFQSLDIDDNNQIAYTEFLAAAMQGRVKVHEAVMRRTFARFDKDNSGYISVENLREVLGETWESKGMEELIREADANGNGQIDYDEFLAYFHHSVEEDCEEGSTESGVGFEEGTAVAAQKTPARSPNSPWTPGQRKHMESMANHIDFMLAANTATTPSPLRRKDKTPCAFQTKGIDPL